MQVSGKLAHAAGVAFLGVILGYLPPAFGQFCPTGLGSFFEDVLSTDPFCGSVTWMSINGITLGCGGPTVDPLNRNYCPVNEVSRVQMAAFMSRLAGVVQPTNCSAGQVLKWNGAGWVCSNDVVGGVGTVTGVTAGFGLNGVTITQSGTISIDTSVTQARITGACLSGSSIRSINSNGTVVCQTDVVGTGTVTSVATGSGLTGGVITTSGTIAVDTSAIQARVSGMCPGGSAIRAISADGSVVCQPPDPVAQAQSVPRANSLVTLATGGYEAGLQISSDGMPGIVSTHTSGLSFTKCLDPDCRSAAAPRLLETSTTRLGPVLTGADGLPVIVFSQPSLKALFCEDVNCNSTTGPNDIDVTSSSPPSAGAILLDGTLVIAYIQDAQLRVVKCSNPRCSGSQAIAIVAYPVYGTYLGLAIGVDGMPIISLAFEPTLNEERVAVLKCSTVNCIGAVTQTTVDFGEGNAIAVGLDGLPRVVSTYFGSLRVGVCSTVSCNQPPPWTDLLATSRTINISLALDSNDRAVMAVPGRLISCLDNACARFTSVQMAGIGTSLAIRGDGTALATFVSGSAIQVLGCANRACVSNWARR